MHRPRILFLDEPFEGMDAAGVAAATGVIRSLAAGGTAVFLTSHLLEYVERLATTVVVIHQGQILLSTSPRELAAVSPLADADPHGRLERLLLSLSGDLPSAESLPWLRPEGEGRR